MLQKMTKFEVVMGSQTNGCPETHMSQKMVIEAKRKEIGKIRQDEGESCCHKGTNP